MTKEMKEQYKDAPAVATYCICNCGGVEILDILYGIDDYVVYRDMLGDLHKAKINYSRRPGFKYVGGYTIHLDECMRVR